MGQIKSALELALERTKDIQEDKAGLRANQLREEGMKLMVRWREEPGFEMAKALQAYDKSERRFVIAGLRQHLMAGLALPADEAAVLRLESLVPLFLLVGNKNPALQEYLSQIPAFMRKYLANREQIITGAKQQYEPMLRRKEENLSRQSGRSVKLSFEQDPEFANYLSKNLEALTNQVQGVLEQIKGELSSILDDEIV